MLVMVLELYQSSNEIQLTNLLAKGMVLKLDPNASSLENSPKVYSNVRKVGLSVSLKLKFYWSGIQSLSPIPDKVSCVEAPSTPGLKYTQRYGKMNHH